MKDKYKWDVEEMRHCVRQMETQKNNLAGYKNEIATLQADIEQALNNR